MAMFAERCEVRPDAGVRLVPLAEKHLAATLAWVNDPAMMRLLGRSAHVEPDEHMRWFEQLRERNDRRYFSVEAVESGHHVGNIWLWDNNTPDRKAEVRVLFGDETSRGRGYGSEAIDQLAGIAFRTMGLHRLYAYVFTFNPQAKRAFEKAGFRQEGMLRQDRRIADDYIDVCVFGRVDSDASGAAEHQPLQGR